jgi:hypothetical protein
MQQLPTALLRPLTAGLPEDDARFVLHIAQGAPGTVIRLTQNPELLRAERTLHTQASAFWESRTLREKLRMLEPLAERGEQDGDHFLLHLALALRARPSRTAGQVRAFHAFTRDLDTNVHRGLLLQEFALNA